MDREQPRPEPTQRIVFVSCPNCDSHKALVAATHYGEFLCFCPVCEHVWDCDAALLKPASN